MSAPFPALPPLKECGLCGGQGELQESHLIPSFVIQDLRASSGTGHIRDNHTPNRRIQDAETVRLLCRTCEQLVSPWEKAFAERVYRPLLAEPKSSAEFDSWMSRFVASLTWKILRRYQLLGLLPEPPDAFESAERAWREFLLGRREHVGPHELHMLPLEAPSSVPGPGAVQGLEPVPANWSRYSLTTVAYDLPVAEKSGSAFVFVKLPRFAFFGVARAGRKFPLIQGTKLPMRKGRIAPRGYKLGVAILNYMSEKAREGTALIASLSAAQKAKIQEAIRANPDRVLDSESFRAMKADVDLFGADAFRKAEPTDRS